LSATALADLEITALDWPIIINGTRFARKGDAHPIHILHHFNISTIIIDPFSQGFWHIIKPLDKLDNESATTTAPTTDHSLS